MVLKKNGWYPIGRGRENKRITKTNFIRTGFNFSVPVLFYLIAKAQVPFTYNCSLIARFFKNFW